MAAARPVDSIVAVVPCNISSNSNSSSNSSTRCLCAPVAKRPPVEMSRPLYDPIARGGSRRRTSSDSKVKVLNSILEESIDKSSDIYQRTAWLILQRSIYNLLNKVKSETDICKIYEKLIQLNILRGKGIFCRLIMDDNLFSNKPNKSHFAALVSLINVHFPVIGNLLLTRLILQFENAFRQNDKSQCLSSVAFIAHLINQNVADMNLAFEIVRFLLKSPSENSIEIAGMMWNICGHKVCKANKKKMNVIMEKMKNLLRDKRLDNKVHNMVKVSLKMLRKNKFTSQKFNVVPNGNKHAHVFDLEVSDPEHDLDYYVFDPEYEANEYIYKLFCEQILEIQNEKYVLIYDTDDEINDNNDGNMLKQKLLINLIVLKRTLNLIVNSTISYENSVLKLMDAKLKPGQELEVCFILLNFCCQHKIYNESLGHAAQILCQLNKSLVEPLEDMFIDTYATVHSFDKIKLRNVARFFAHLLFTDTISWMVISSTKLLNETNPTVSNRMYAKILFQELVDHMGFDMLSDRVKKTFQKKTNEEICHEDNDHISKIVNDFFISIGLDDLMDDVLQ